MRRLLLLMWLVVAIGHTHGEPDLLCAAQSLDLFFLVDTSHSLWTDEFKSEVALVKDLLVHYDLTNTRVSVTAYGTDVRSVIELGYYPDHAELNATIDKMRKWGGETNTAAALNDMIDESRKGRENGNENRTHVAILMTDGASTTPERTVEMANIAHDKGIIVFVIVFGSSAVRSKNELSAIASDPDSQHMYLPPDENYADLQSFGKKIIEITCPVCAANPPLDLFFLVDASHSLWTDEFKSEVALVKDLLVHYDLTNTRVCVTAYGTDVRPVIKLGYYSGQAELNALLDDMRKWGGVTNTAAALYNMTEECRKGRETANEKRTEVAILMTDGASTTPERTVEMAKIAHNEGIIMFVIVFGSSDVANEDEVSAIASDPDTQHMYLGEKWDDNYPDLQSFGKKIIEKTCPNMYQV